MYEHRRIRALTPMYTVYIHLDRLRAKGFIRHLILLWGEDPEYEIEDGQVVKYYPCTEDMAESPSCTGW